MRTPFAVVAALIGSSLHETQGRHMDSSDYGMSMAQEGAYSGMEEVSTKHHKDKFEEEDEDVDEDKTGYGHYSTLKDAENKKGKHSKHAKIEHKHHGHHHAEKAEEAEKSEKPEKTHHHQHLAPAEKKKTPAEKAAAKKATADAAAKKEAEKASPLPPPVKGMPPVKNIDKLEGRMIVIRGQHGPKYSFG